MTEAVEEPLAVARPGTFFGEPKALAYLAFTEAWERFSFYGMAGLLTLYMTQALFLPGHVEHVAGFAAFRGALESVLGQMSTLALASQIFGLYSGFVYFTPVFGGWVADRWIGRRPAVMAGAILMSAGHIAMAFDASFLLALALLIVGCGLLKGNISTQVGELYTGSDAAGRTRGFSIFSMAINVGAVAGPIICGILAQAYGWHAGFGLAGILMLFGLVTYVAGYRHLPESAPGEAKSTDAPPLGRHEWRALAALIAVIGLTIFPSIAYYQDANIALVWIDARVDLDLFGIRVPAAVFNSIDSMASIVFVPVLIVLWRRQAARRGEPTEIKKIAIGAFISALANALLAAASGMSDRVNVLVPIVYYIVQGVAFLYYWPTLLAFASRTAPVRVVATMMGVVFMSLFVANILIGWLGGLYEPMGPAAFWAMHVGIAVAGGVLALALKRPLERILIA